MNTTQHLSDEQFAELLVTPQTENVHLQACPQCRAELTAMDGSLTAFRGAITDFASATTLPPFNRPVVAVRSTARQGWLSGRGLAAGFAAVLVIAGGSVAIMHPAHPVAVHVTAPETATLSDEALLEGINQDLSTSVAPTLAPLTVTETASVSAQR